MDQEVAVYLLQVLRQFWEGGVGLGRSAVGVDVAAVGEETLREKDERER